MPDAAAESRDPHSLLNLYRALLRLRAGCRPLQEGSYYPLDSGDQVLAFERCASDERVLVVLNFGAEPASVEALVPGAATHLLSTVPGPGTAGWLAPYEGVILRL